MKDIWIDFQVLIAELSPMWEWMAVYYFPIFSGASFWH